MKNLKYDFFKCKGYQIIKLFSKKDVKDFKKQICKSLNNKKILKLKLNDNNLHKYHKLINNEKDH